MTTSLRLHRLGRALLIGPLPLLLCGAIVFALGAGSVESVAQAPETAGRCFATLGSSGQYSGFTSAVVQLAVDAAAPGALVKVAGDCAGVQVRGGTTQSVVISKPLTLQGGFTTSNWISSDAAANPTILDAGGLGQVISATSDLTVADLRVQNGWVSCAAQPSCSGNKQFALGGGIYAGARLNLSHVDVLSNTAVCNAVCYGGGVYADGATEVASGIFENNLCSANGLVCTGGGMFVTSTVSLTGTRFIRNTASGAGGALDAMTITLSGGLFQANQCTSNLCLGGAVAAANTFAITNSRFLNNFASTAGGAVFGNGGGSIHESCITGNQVDAVHGFSATQPIDATHNWWGAGDGANPPGHGDQIGGSVNATPYLTTPVGACLFSASSGQVYLPLIVR